MKQKKEYDLAQRSKALTGLGLRVVVAGYIVYLAWKILTGMMNGTSPIPVWAVWLICIVLTAVALGFCAFSWKAYRKNLKAAEIPIVTESKSADPDTNVTLQKGINASNPEDL